jgi:uncharacterized protein YjbI with pentapeptide repeats
MFLVALLIIVPTIILFLVSWLAQPLLSAPWNNALILLGIVLAAVLASLSGIADTVQLANWMTGKDEASAAPPADHSDLFNTWQKDRETDVKLALEKQSQTTLENYLERIKDLLLDRNLGPDAQPEVKRIARVLTLLTVKVLTSVHNRQLFQFLQESKLLDDDSGIDLREADLNESDLRGVNLEGVNLYFTQLKGADMRGANLSRARLIAANLNGAKLNGVNLKDAILSDANLTEADLSEADMRRAHLKGAYLNKAILHGADLGNACLSEAKLIDANLNEARLNSVDLRSARLDSADLSQAYLEGANMQRVNLVWAKLDGAVLTNADLNEAYLHTASLRGAYLNNTNLSGASLRDATGLTVSQLREARLPDETNMPDGRTYWEWKQE